MISKKKVTEIEAVLQYAISDEFKLKDAMTSIKSILNYSDDKPHYDKAYYEKKKQKLAEQGQSTWSEYQKRYYQEHREEMNQKRNEYRRLAKLKAQEPTDA